VTIFSRLATMHRRFVAVDAEILGGSAEGPMTEQADVECRNRLGLRVGVRVGVTIRVTIGIAIRVAVPIAVGITVRIRSQVTVARVRPFVTSPADAQPTGEQNHEPVPAGHLGAPFDFPVARIRTRGLRGPEFTGDPLNDNTLTTWKA
jgi:hypothetical protein